MDKNLQTTENPLDIFRIASNETILISDFPTVESEESILSKAPGEVQRLMSVLNDDYLHIHIFSPMVNLGIKLKEIYFYLQVIFELALFETTLRNFNQIQIIYLCPFSFATVKLE